MVFKQRLARNRSAPLKNRRVLTDWDDICKQSDPL